MGLIGLVRVVREGCLAARKHQTEACAAPSPFQASRGIFMNR